MRSITEEPQAQTELRMREACGWRGGTSGQEAGFSLIELLIAITLFAIVAGAIYGLLEVARADRHTTNQRVEVMQNLRVGLNAIGRDALNAGHEYRNVGALLPGDSLFAVLNLPYTTLLPADFLTPVVSGRNINGNVLTGAAALTPGATDQITFVYRELTFNGGRAVPLTAVNADGSVVTIDTNGPDGVPGGGDDINNNVGNQYDVHMIRSETGAALAVRTDAPDGGNTISFTVNDPPSFQINAPTADLTIPCNPTPLNVIRLVMIRPCVPPGPSGVGNVRPTTLTRIIAVTYRVLNDGTLVRTTYGGSAIGQQDMPLAYNIEDMQIEYVLENGDLTTDPAEGPDGITGSGGDDDWGNLRNVRQVQVTLIARSPEVDRRNNQFFRITLSATFSARNLEYL